VDAKQLIGGSTLFFATFENNKFFFRQDTKARGRSSDLLVVFLRALPGFHQPSTFSTFKQQKISLFQ